MTGMEGDLFSKLRAVLACHAIHGRKLKDEEEASVVVVEKVVVVECPRGARLAGARQFRFGSSATTASVRIHGENGGRI